MTFPDGEAAAERPAQRPPRPVDRVAFGLAIAISAVILFAPSAGGVPLFPYADKLVHTLTFALLAWTGARAGARPIPLALVLVGYAAASEVIQGTLLPKRDGDVFDAVADSFGVFVGLMGTAPGRRALRDAVPGAASRRLP